VGVEICWPDWAIAGLALLCVGVGRAGGVTIPRGANVSTAWSSASTGRYA
jgi:hypothetical protein